MNRFRLACRRGRCLIGGALPRQSSAVCAACATLPAARRTNELIAQTAAVDPRLFFRLLEDVADLMTRRFVLRYDDVVQLLRKRGELGKVEAASARGRNQVMSDVAELQRLGLRPGMWLIIDGKVWSNWSTEALAQALLQKDQQGFFAAEKNLATP